MSTYTPIATQTLSADTPKVTFSSIPQNYTDLVVQMSIRGDRAAGQSDSYKMTFNNDSSASYGYRRMVSNTGSSSVYPDGGSNWNYLQEFDIARTSYDSNIFTPVTVHVQNYSNTAVYKSVLTRNNDSVSPYGVGLGASTWRSFDAVTSISIAPGSGNNIVQGSVITIYGVSAGNSSAKATGGNIVTTDGTYWYHAFTNTASFIPSEALTADVLVIAGGAGGGAGHGGGGGAGGVLAFSSQSLSASNSYLCTVGAGGAGGTPGYSQRGFSGNNSQFASLTETIGGGGGGSYNNAASATGGSGGGGGGGPSTISGSAGTSGQGNNGGTGTTNGTAGGGGGGGGKGGNGSDAAGNNGGQGGAGTNSVTNWGSLSSALTSLGLGVSGYIAGGGGGGAWQATGGNGGSGGGGNGRGAGYEGGAYVNAGFPATANTGSGGGGGPDYNNGGGRGASGLIIIRYAV